MIHFQPPVYHDLLVQTIKRKGLSDLIVFKSDNDLILHQECLKSYTDKQIENLVTANSAPPMPQMSDDDLFLACKSRRIQSASELKQWSDFLDDMQNQLKEQFKKAHEKKSDVKKDEKSDVKKDVKPEV